MTVAHLKFIDYGFNKLARELNTSTTSLYRWLNAPKSMQIRTLEKLRELTGVELDDFFNDIEIQKDRVWK